MKVIQVRNNPISEIERLNYGKVKMGTIIKEGFQATNGHFYKLEIHDQINFIDQYNELMADPRIQTVQWVIDGDLVSHTREEWIKVYFESIKYKRESRMVR